MCIVDKKTYIQPDGTREVVETINRCYRATGSRLCARTETRMSETARLVEVKPTDDEPSSSSGGVLVMQGRDGRERLYRDVTRRTRRMSSKRNSNNMSPIERPPSSSSSTASYLEMRPRVPRAPTPPPALAGPQIPQRRSVTFQDEFHRIVTPDGTAIYDAPSRGGRLPSPFSAGGDEPGSSSPITPGSASPGLSQLPKVGNLKHDSARDLPGQESRPRAGTGESQLSSEGRRRRHQDREHRTLRRTDETSRERHRRKAAAALEGLSAPTPRSEEDLRQANLDAEFAQMARERAANDARNQRGSFTGSRNSSDERLRRDADAFAAGTGSPRVSTIVPRQAPFGVAAVHQNSTLVPTGGTAATAAARMSDSLRERGEDILSRERVKASSQRLAGIMGSLDIDDELENNEDDRNPGAGDGRYVDEGVVRRRERRDRDKGKGRRL